VQHAREIPLYAGLHGKLATRYSSIILSSYISTGLNSPEDNIRLRNGRVFTKEVNDRMSVSGRDRRDERCGVERSGVEEVRGF